MTEGGRGPRTCSSEQVWCSWLELHRVSQGTQIMRWRRFAGTLIMKDCSDLLDSLKDSALTIGWAAGHEGDQGERLSSCPPDGPKQAQRRRERALEMQLFIFHPTGSMGRSFPLLGALPFYTGQKYLILRSIWTARSDVGRISAGLVVDKVNSSHIFFLVLHCSNARNRNRFSWAGAQRQSPTAV